MILQLINLAGALGVFLFGMRLMSDGIHGVAGARMQSALDLVTRNRFIAVGTGFIVTGIIQSSSATTVILVSLVNAGLLTLPKAIGVIMGANIGTTVTGWIVAVLGFKVDITNFALPAIGFSLPLMFSRREKLRDYGNVLLGFGILFLGIDLLKKLVPDVKNYPDLLGHLSSLSDPQNTSYVTILTFVAIGTLITFVMQSSSAAMAITLTMASKGWISFPVSAAIILGENIGTTITANLAALGMNANAKRAARAHLLFNVLGVCWMVPIIFPFLRFIDELIPGSLANPTDLPTKLAAFHSAFNIVNTSLLIWFINPLAKLAETMVRGEPGQMDEMYLFPHRTSRLPEGTEVNLINARSEIGKMADDVHEILLKVLQATTTNDAELMPLHKTMELRYARVATMKEKISAFLAESATNQIGEEEAFRLVAMLRIVNELEKTADSSTKIVSALSKKHRKALAFHDEAFVELERYTSLVLDFFRYNADYLGHRMPQHNLELAAQMEREVDKMMKTLKKVSGSKMREGADVQAELLFIDILRHLEHIGDFCLNIAQVVKQLDN